MDFEQLTNQHKDTVYRQMIRVCGNREDAEDVLVDALVRAHRHIGELRDSAAFQAWLAQIGRRVCWQLREREKLLPFMQLSLLEEEGYEFATKEPTPEARVAAGEMKSLVAEAVRQLPEDYRGVYQLRDIDEVSGDEVARRLGISLAAMKSRLHRARELVRQRLDEILMGRTGS